MRQLFVILFIFTSIFGFAHTISATMSGGGFQITSDAFSVVSPESSSGGDFVLLDTAGEFGASTGTVGGVIELRGGFQAAENGILRFSVSPGSIQIGPLSSGAVSASAVSITMTTDSQTGYTVSATEDGNLRSGSDTITDVADGVVTAGSREYGIRTSGTDGLLGSDTPINGSVAIASSVGAVIARQTDIQFRVAIDGSMPAGNYSHIVTFTATVNP